MSSVGSASRREGATDGPIVGGGEKFTTTSAPLQLCARFHVCLPNRLSIQSQRCQPKLRQEEPSLRQRRLEFELENSLQAAGPNGA